MSDISNSIRLTDYMSSTLRTINSTMEHTISIMERMDLALQSLGADAFSGMNHDLQAVMARLGILEAMLGSIGEGAPPGADAITRLNTQLSAATVRIVQLEAQLVGLGGVRGSSTAMDALNADLAEAHRHITQLEGQMVGLSTTAARTGNHFGGWAMHLMGVFSALQMIAMVVGAINRMLEFTDQFTNANARLGLVNDGLQTQKRLQSDILAMANRTRSSYQGTADLIAKIGMTGAMKSTKDTLALAEKVNKLMIIGGGGAQQNEAALLQFSQSLASGKMQGDEFRSLRENAPALMNTIAQGLGVSAGQLRQMSTDGLLTTEVIIGAMENMGATIDEQFAQMPRTFGQNMQVMKNELGNWLAEMAQADGALGRLNQAFSSLVVWLGSADGSTFFANIEVGLNVLVLLFSTIGQTAQMLLPSVNAVFAAIGWGVENVVSVVSFLANLIFGAMPLMAGAVALAAGVYLILYGNTLMSAAAIALHMAWTKLAAVATTLWAGAIAVLRTGVTLLSVALRANPIGMVITLVMMAIAIFSAWQIATKGLRQTFSSVFGFIVDTVQTAVNFIITAINGVIRAFNAVGGTVGKVLGFDYSQVHEVAYRANFSGFKAAGQDIIENMSWNDLKAKVGLGTMPDSSALAMPGGSSMAAMAGGDIGKVDQVGKVGKIDSAINLADEDLKYLVSLSTQKYVNNINLAVQTSAPVIHSNATVREEADVDKIVDGVAAVLGRDRKVTVEQEF